MREEKLPQKTALEIVLDSFKDGPKFPQQIGLPRRLRNFSKWFLRRQVSRSKNCYLIEKQKTYAYYYPEKAGSTLTWIYKGKTFTDTFILSENPKHLHRRRDELKVTQNMVLKVLDEHGALFSDEIFSYIQKERPEATLKSVKDALYRLKKKGEVIRFDEKHRGWRFASGYLYALPERAKDFVKRLESLDDKVLTSHEKSFLNHVRYGIWLAKELKEETGLEDSWITYMLRKFGKEAPIKVYSRGLGENYRIEVEEVAKQKLGGKGLIPWIRWVNLFGNIVIYDEENISKQELYEFLKKTGYWLSEEGKRRQLIGKIWEDFTKEFFDACDKNSEWQLRVIEHRQNWRGRSNKEFDHVYVCQLGPKELNLTQYIIFECKSGTITNAHIDEFYQKAINEPEFRNWATGGIKSNIMLVLVTGKTAEKTAIQKASKMGIKIVFHTQMEEILARLTGKPKITFYKIVKSIEKTHSKPEPTIQKNKNNETFNETIIANIQAPFQEKTQKKAYFNDAAAGI